MTKNYEEELRPIAHLHARKGRVVLVSVRTKDKSRNLVLAFVGELGDVFQT